jgi:hypothetical protein
MCDDKLISYVIKNKRSLMIHRGSTELKFMRFVKNFINSFTVLIAIVFLLVTQTAAADTKITLSHSIDTPDRTVSYENNTYEIQDIGFYHIKDPVNITITTKDIKSYTIALLDTKMNFLWYQIVYHTEGKEELTMPAGIVTSPGTYIFAVFYQGDILDFEQVLFSNITLSMTLNTSQVIPGGLLHVDVTAFPDTDLPIKVVFAQESRSLEFPVNRTSSGQYEADIIIPSSANGRFSSYAAMTSGKIVLGYPEIVGVSNGGILEIIDFPQKSSDKTNSLPVISPFFLAVLLVLASRMIRK